MHEIEKRSGLFRRALGFWSGVTVKSSNETPARLLQDCSRNEVFEATLDGRLRRDRLPLEQARLSLVVRTLEAERMRKSAAREDFDRRLSVESFDGLMNRASDMYRASQRRQHGKRALL